MGLSGFQGDPTGVKQDILGFGGTDPLLDYGMQAFQSQLDKQAAAQNQYNSFWGQSSTMGGTPASLGGDWSKVDQWNSAISAASAKYGVPANLIKAVMRLESGGNWIDSDPGAGAVGVMQIMPFWNGTAGLNIYDPTQNIAMGAYILSQAYKNQGTWEGAAREYFAGPGGAWSGNTDAYGTNPNTYWATVNRYWQELNGASGTAGTGYNPNPGGSGNISSIFGGTTPPISFEFNAGGGPNLYAYGTSYGLNGSNHTGLDVSVPMKTPYYSPGAGTVTCAGTNNGPGADGGGCAAFQDTIGGGAGRVEIQLDNGTVLIFGHSNQSAVKVGQRVNAGTLLGLSGGMNGPHVHLEARVRDPSMPSGWRIVDPRTVLGGGFVPGMAQIPGGFGAAPGMGSSGGASMNEMMWRFLTQPGTTW
jgi:murein DD-endopeptidase MepM/ murein hydrolase activator NlpD